MLYLNSFLFVILISKKQPFSSPREVKELFAFSFHHRCLNILQKNQVHIEFVMFSFLIKFLTKTNKRKNQGRFKKHSHPSRNLLSFSLSLFQMPADRIFAVIVSVLSMTFHCAEPQGNHSGISTWNLFALLLGNFPIAHKVTGPDGNVKMVCLNRMECVSGAVQSTRCVKRYLTQTLCT